MPKLMDPGPAEPAQAVADEDLDFKVAFALKEDPELESFVISVLTTEGVAALEGKVHSQGQVERATEVALGVTGIQGVDNRLIVKRVRRRSGPKTLRPR